MNFIKCDVSTICMGMAASMGAFLLAAGAKGKYHAKREDKGKKLFHNAPIISNFAGESTP